MPQVNNNVKCITKIITSTCDKLNDAFMELVILWKEVIMGESGPSLASWVGDVREEDTILT